jgi:hypothetical protein
MLISDLFSKKFFSKNFYLPPVYPSIRRQPPGFTRVSVIFVVFFVSFVSGNIPRSLFPPPPLSLPNFAPPFH